VQNHPRHGTGEACIVVQSHLVGLEIRPVIDIGRIIGGGGTSNKRAIENVPINERVFDRVSKRSVGSTMVWVAWGVVTKSDHVAAPLRFAPNM
jgi:hypothetical protein